MTIVNLRSLEKVRVNYPEYAKRWLADFREYLNGKPSYANPVSIDHFDKKDALDVYNNLKIKNKHLIYTSEKVEPTILAKVLQGMIRNEFLSTISFETSVYNQPFNLIEKITVYENMYIVR